MITVFIPAKHYSALMDVSDVRYHGLKAFQPEAKFDQFDQGDMFIVESEEEKQELENFFAELHALTLKYRKVR